MVTGIIKTGNEIPSEFILYQNYPNPFNPVTKIKFSIGNSPFEGGTSPERSRRKVDDLVKLIIYNVEGKEISTLVNSQLVPGNYEVEWNASNVSSGIYFYKLEAWEYKSVKKMILVK